MKPKSQKKIATILSEFFGLINEETKDRVLFAEMDTGDVVPCLVSHELTNAPIADGDIVLLEFIDMETAMIWTKSSYCVVEIIQSISYLQKYN